MIEKNSLNYGASFRATNLNCKDRDPRNFLKGFHRRAQPMHIFEFLCARNRHSMECIPIIILVGNLLRKFCVDLAIELRPVCHRNSTRERWRVEGPVICAH